MLRKAEAAGCILQVGHVERFNGGFQAAASILKAPRFIESHRLATFSPRGTDVSVVVDLMIHDIDLILSILHGDKIVDLRASGAWVLTGSPDIVNARLEFEGGCVANITASRISREPLRKIRFFEENLYVSADLRSRSVEAYQKREGTGRDSPASDDPTSFIRKIPLEVDQGEPLRKEVSSFIDCIRSGGTPPVTGREALDALIVAERVLRETGVDGRRT
jgi:predicted dehydrogenase